MISKLTNMDYERGASKAMTWLACVALVELVAGAVAGYVIGVMVAEEDAAKSGVAAANIVERSEQCTGTGGL